MGMDLNQFDRGARAAALRVVARTEETIRSAALLMYSELTYNIREEGHGSPVASGRYASSMRVGINQIDASTAPADPTYRYPKGHGPRPLPDRTIKNTAVSRVAALLRTFKLGDTVYVSNSLPYSRKIEVGGHSWQAPGGVFFPTVRRVLAKFSNVNISVRS